jgi:hypothetical protein
MLDILDTYLASNATPELAQTIKTALTVFDKIGVDSYEQKYEELLMLDDMVDQGATLSAIVDITKNMQREILSEHSVVLHDSVGIDVMSIFISGLMLIADYDDKEQLLKITKLEEPAEEVLAELLALVTEKSAEELLVEIESVSQFLINRVAELATASEDVPSEEEVLQKAVHVTAYKYFCNYIQTNPLLISQLLNNGIDVGFSFAVYAKLISADLESLTPKQIAYELIAAALLSIDGIDNVRSIITENLENLVHDIDKITQVNIAVSDTLLGFNPS